MTSVYKRMNWQGVCQALHLLEKGEVTDACYRIRQSVNLKDTEALETVFETMTGMVEAGLIRDNIAYMVMDEFV